MDTESIARGLVETSNRGAPDWVDEFHARSTEWIELPFLGSPGRRGGFTELRKAAEDQVANFPDRRMEILTLSPVPIRRPWRSSGARRRPGRWLGPTPVKCCACAPR